MIKCQEFYGTDLVKTIDHMNNFPWDKFHIISIESVKRAGIVTIRVWFKVA